MNRLCGCNCGEEVKSSSARFIRGHNKAHLGKHHSHETRLKLSIKIKSNTVQEKYKQTNLERTGYDNPSKNPIIKQKNIDASRAKYNTDYIFQADEIKEKSKKSMISIHGVEHALQSEKSKRKYRNTSQQHYHKDNPMQDDSVLKLYNQTMIELYGVPWPSQSKEIQEKSKLSLIKRYGVDNYSKTSEFRQLARRLLKESILRDYPCDAKWCPRKGNYEKEVFDELQKHCLYPILEDKEFIGLHPDRYINEINMIIELYEPWHKRECYAKRDPIRQKELEDYLGCKFFIIWLDEWKENKENIIEQFKTLIQSSTKYEYQSQYHSQ